MFTHIMYKKNLLLQINAQLPRNIKILNEDMIAIEVGKMTNIGLMYLIHLSLKNLLEPEFKKRLKMFYFFFGLQSINWFII